MLFIYFDLICIYINISYQNYHQVSIDFSWKLCYYLKAILKFLHTSFILHLICFIYQLHKFILFLFNLIINFNINLLFLSI